MLNVASAYTQIVFLNCFFDILERKPISTHLHGIGLNVVLLHIASDRIHSRKARDCLHLWCDDPVLYSSEKGPLLKISLQNLSVRGNETSFCCKVHSPDIDFAQTCGYWAHAGLDFGWQRFLGFLKAFANLLSCEIDIHIVIEDGSYL